MNRVLQFITNKFSPHHGFLPDDEYGRALDTIVKACSDVLVCSDDRQRVFLGRRKVHPQPDWWFFGGRVRPGESTQDGAARLMRRELTLDIAPSRFHVLSTFSFVWGMREQAPVDHGCADISTVHCLQLTPEEVASVHLDEAEYLGSGWFTLSEVMQGQFHPALKQCIRDLRADSALERLRLGVDSGDDTTVADLARQFIRESACASEQPVQIFFDEEARVYQTTSRESG